MPVFGADHDVRNAIVVEIDRSRTGRVSRESPRIERSTILETPLAVATFGLAQPSRVGAIDEKVQLAVAVEINNAKLSPTACAGLLGVELQRFSVHAAEHALGRQQLQRAPIVALGNRTR